MMTGLIIDSRNSLPDRACFNTRAFLPLLLLLSLLLSLLLLTACSNGPDDALLEAELQQRLDQQFSDKLFHLKKLSRKGTAPRLDGEEGLYVYYNLELEFLRDYNLISWRGLNVGTLAAVLGASTTSIEGFSRDGNKAGDHLLIRGRLSFREIGDKWQANKFTPIQTEEKTVAETLDTPSPSTIIKHIRQLVGNNTYLNRSEKDRVTLQELQRSLSRIDLGHASIDGSYTFGTGWPNGSYHDFGEAFADYANEHDFKIYNYASEGSLENGYRLNTGRLDFALLQSDVAEVLYDGWVEEGQLPSPDLRAIASLWPEAIHILVLDKSGIKKFSDLEGKRFAIGSLRSGTRFTAARIWLASGFERMDYDKIKILGRGNSIKALENEEVDAIVIAGALPDPAIQKLLQRRDDIHFIPLKQSVVTRLAEMNFAYYGQPIPAKTYPGQDESVMTLGVAALLTTNINTPDEVVTRFMELLREGAENISQKFYQAGFFTLKTSRLGISMPLHPAAKSFYDMINEELAAAKEQADEKGEKEQTPLKSKISPETSVK